MSLALCLTTLGGALLAAVPAKRFELTWTHSVERTEWRESWQVTAGGLRLTGARVRGGGAGMEPPPDARLQDGWWVWEADGPAQATLVLAASAFTAEHRLCVGQDCRPLSGWVGIVDRPVVLRACD